MTEDKIAPPLPDRLSVDPGNPHHVAAVFEHLAHPYTRGLFAARPTLGLKRGTRLATIPGRVPDIDEMPAGCPFAERCPLVIDACRSAEPPNVVVAPTHFARCLKAEVLA